MAGEITCPACLVKSYAMMTMRKRIPGQQKMRCPGIFLVSNMIMEFCTMVVVLHFLTINRKDGAVVVG